MAVVKAVSFQEDVIKYGLKVSKELFGNNFSILIKRCFSKIMVLHTNECSYII